MVFLNLTFLSTLEIFKEIPVCDIPNAIKCLKGRTKTFEEGERIYSYSENISEAGIILSGGVFLNQIQLSGKNTLLKEFSKGEMFGATLCAEETQRNNLIFTANTKAEILFLKLPNGSVQHRCSCNYKMIIMENLFKIVSKEINQMNKKIQILSQVTLREKLMMYFDFLSQEQNSKAVQLNLTREHLADYINAERSAVSRELSRMQKENIISIEKKKVTLLCC